MDKASQALRVGVIMAGGSGERFWPLSRKHRPKQLLLLTSETQTMLAEAVARLDPLIPPELVYVVTGEHLVEPIRQAKIGVPDENVIAEPCKRNTAGALAYAAAHLLATHGGDGSNITMAITTADHLVGEPEQFRGTVLAAMEVAEEQNALATLGVRPTRPETGYGYIQIKDEDAVRAARNGSPAVHWVSAFHEKPNRERADHYISTGKFFWNSGMFFWRVSTFLKEFEEARPDFAQATRDIAEAKKTGDDARVRAIFEGLEDISIDFALMEKAEKVVMACAEFPWDDIGAWPALDRTFSRDDKQNVAVGGPILIDTEDTIVYNEPGADNVAVGVVGADGLVVVVTKDAVLVTPKDRAQDVKKVVQELKERGKPQV